jgi:type I restriction enzyme S subunit
METILDKMIVEKYAEYKNTADDILGAVPLEWETRRLKEIAKIENSGIWGKDDQSKGLFSVKVPTTGDLSIDGKWLKDKMEVRWLTKIEKQTYLCRYGDIVVVKSSGSADNIISGKAGYIDSDEDGEIAFGNFLLRLRPLKIHSKFLYYFIISETTKSRIERMVSTTTYPNIKIPEYINALIPVPSPDTQATIVQFLNRKTAFIDQAIGIKRKQIELLKERRQILIHKAVTRGLNPNVKMKDSGVEWIGEIPEKWVVKKLKYILNERNERSSTGVEPLFMMSQVHGLVVRADYHIKAEVAKTAEGNKIVHKNDLVFNKLKAHLGVFFKSTIDFNGIVSPDYAVYYSKGIIDDLKYLELLFRCPEYLKQFICRTTGIVEGLMRLYTHDLFDIAIPVPPINEQKEILSFIYSSENKITTAISLKEQEIEKLKEYKATLINSAVTGKIKVS